MKVTDKNYDEYLKIRNCKYQVTFPIINIDALNVICTRGVDIEGLAPYQYAPKCKGCIGKRCADIEAREQNDSFKVVENMENKFLGTIVEWENERWYVDNTDDEFKDEVEETSLFLLPEKYADAEENDKLMRYGSPDSVGYWVYESEVKAI